MSHSFNTPNAGLVPVMSLLGLLLCGCASVPGVNPTLWEPMKAAPVAMAAPPVTGGIYAQGYDVRFFEDVKSRRVGDILTITLSERTDGSVSNGTSTSRDNALSMGPATFAGGPVPRSGAEIFNNSFSADRSFTGAGDSSQSNSLDGSITVTVRQVMPNGNLIVQGEKWIQINQSTEFIRLTGIVRPMDVQVDNTVQSLRVADARIEYEPSGPMATTNREGWLSRVFNVISPL